MARKSIQARIDEAKQERKALDARIKELQAAERKRISALEKSAAAIAGRWVIAYAKAKNEAVLSMLRDAVGSDLEERDQAVLLEVFPDLLCPENEEVTEDSPAAEHTGQEERESGEVGESMSTNESAKEEWKKNPFSVDWRRNYAE